MKYQMIFFLMMKVLHSSSTDLLSQVLLFLVLLPYFYSIEESQHLTMQKDPNERIEKSVDLK